MYTWRHCCSYLGKAENWKGFSVRRTKYCGWLPGAALLLVALLGHLLHNILTFLSGGWQTLPGPSIVTLLVINILGDGGGHIGADLVRDVIADLAGLGDVATDLLLDRAALLPGLDGALAVGDLSGLDLGHEGADTPGLPLAVLAGNLAAGLPGQHLAVDLGHLGALELRHLGTLLAGEAAALLGCGLLAFSPGDSLALLLLHGGALPLLDIIAVFPGHILAHLLLLWHVAALLLGNLHKAICTRTQFKDMYVDHYLATLLSDNISALLGVVDLLADLSGHGLALLSIHGVALTAVAHLPLTLLLVHLLALTAGLVLEE